MPQLPVAEPSPADGALPRASRERWGQRPFGVYIHVPFCTTRCGYCDFNTYTAEQLGPGVDRTTFPAHLATEISFARQVLGSREVPVSTVFVGGGTPTLLAAGQIGGVLQRVRDEFGLVAGAEVTVEANPDSVDPRSLAELREVGITRISFGMQSAVDRVLAVLDRTHHPGRTREAVGWARAAGFDRISLDLIYGTPGETLADWQRTVEAALGCEVGHVSAYALIVEEGTKLSAAVRRGVIDPPDDDLMADMYELADERFAAAGLSWYELSNWARPGQECAHNLLYWRGDDWWGAGPGAHSHVAGTRWWNVKHPASYVRRLAQGLSPSAGREVLDDRARSLERVMLGVRMSAGLALAELEPQSRQEVVRLVAEGLCTQAAGRVRLTLAGRLLADAVVRRLVP